MKVGDKKNHKTTSSNAYANKQHANSESIHTPKPHSTQIQTLTFIHAFGLRLDARSIWGRHTHSTREHHKVEERPTVKGDRWTESISETVSLDL